MTPQFTAPIHLTSWVVTAENIGTCCSQKGLDLKNEIVIDWLIFEKKKSLLKDCNVIQFCQLSQVGNQEHEGDEEAIAVGRLTRKIEEKITGDPSKPVKRVFNKVVTNAREVPVEYIPDFHGIHSRLYRRRESLLPPIPHDIEDVSVEGEWEQTWSGHQFKCHQDNDWGILIFATDSNFKILRRCETIYIDGTFKTCPKPYMYMQFVSIHGIHHGHVLPLVSCLQTGKQVGQYWPLLQVVKRKVRALSGRRFRPRKVISDLEHSLLIAVQTELPGARICRCYFHFNQSMWRKIQELKMAQAYNRRRSLWKCLRQLMAIGYLPLALVRQNCNNLLNSRRTQHLVGRYPALREFLAYMSRNYLDGDFPPPMWNVFDRDSDTCTNNHVEGM